MASVFQSLWADNYHLADTDTAFACDQPFVIFHFPALSLTGGGEQTVPKGFSWIAQQRDTCVVTEFVCGELRENWGGNFLILPPPNQPARQHLFPCLYSCCLEACLLLSKANFFLSNIAFAIIVSLFFVLFCLCLPYSHSFPSAYIIFKKASLYSHIFLQLPILSKNFWNTYLQMLSLFSQLHSLQSIPTGLWFSPHYCNGSCQITTFIGHFSAEFRILDDSIQHTSLLEHFPSPSITSKVPLFLWFPMTLLLTLSQSPWLVSLLLNFLMLISWTGHSTQYHD